MNSRGNLVSAIRTGMHNEPQLKTRVVLDMVPGGDYDFAQEFEIQNNTLKITIFHAGQKKKAQQDLQVGATTRKDPVVPVKITAPVEAVKKTPPVEAVKNPTSVAVAKISSPVAAEIDPPPPPPPAPAPVKSPLPVETVKASAALSSQLFIKKISFEKSPDKGEKVLFELKNFHPPVVFGNEEGASPSIICDFMVSRLGDGVPEIIPAKGKFVKQVRVETSAESSKIRVVLELVPNRHYDLQQIFFKEEDLYVLFVNSPDSEGKP